MVASATMSGNPQCLTRREWNSCMPELPEVQTVVSTLAPRITGSLIRAVVMYRRDIVTPADFDLPEGLTDRVVRSVTRRGKRIVFMLDDDNRFYIHLGMTGRLTLESATAHLLPHTHAIFYFSEIELRFR